MKSSEMYLLIVKDFRRRLNEEEQQLLANWRGESAENEHCYQQLRQILQAASLEEPLATPDIRVEWEKLRRELGLGGEPNQTYMPQPSRRNSGGFRWIYGAVASLAIVVTAIWLLTLSLSVCASAIAAAGLCATSSVILSSTICPRPVSETCASA